MTEIFKTVPTSIYDPDVLIDVAHALASTCEIEIRKVDSENLEVSFRSDDPDGVVGLEDRATEFMRLLTQETVNSKVRARTQHIRELITRQAFAEAEIDFYSPTSEEQ